MVVNEVKQFVRTILLCAVTLVVSLTASAQSPLQGVVIDTNGQPVVGATVTDADNLSNVVVTDFEGHYSIQVAPKGEIVVEYLGFKPQKIAVAGKNRVDVTLQQDVTMINELVVVGYGTMRKSDVTGSVANVSQKAFEDRPISNIGQALQGRAAGVYIVDSGNPQSNVSLKVRGLGTVNNSDPLYVVDGVPMVNMGLNSLNTEDIASIDILKDASATAIYGARGANGVVMITTRKGAAGDGTISFSSNVGVASPTRVPRLLNASEYAALNNEMMIASENTTNPLWTDPSTLGEGTDWLGEMLRPAVQQHYTLSYSGGDDRNSHYVSGSYSDNDGIVNSVEYQKITFQYNGTNKVKPWLTMTTAVTMSYDNKENGDYSIGDLMKSVPVLSVMAEDGTYNGPTGNSLWYGDKANQVGKSNINHSRTQGYNMLGTQTAEIALFDGLKFKSVGSVGATFVYNESFRPAYDWKPNPLLESERYMGTSRYMSYLWDNYFTYDKEWGDHTFNAMAGSSLQWGDGLWFNGQAKGFLSDTASQFDNATAVEKLKGSRSEWAIASFMGRANYSYKDRYMVTATVRYDGSSKFGPKHRWGFFPSFSAAWRISQEEWFNEDGFVSDLKLRAGYGVTGNQEIGDYTFVSVYNTGQYSFNGNIVNSLVANKLSNQNIHWEEVVQTNIGLDLAMLDNRIRLSIDGYLKDTNGMLVKMVVPISSGYSDTDVPYTNAGKVHNRGIEVTLSTDNLRGGELSWQTDFNISMYRNEVVSLDSADELYYNDAGFGQYFCTNTVGYPIGSFYGWRVEGIFQNEQEVNSFAEQNGAAPGDIRFKDIKGDGFIDDQDREIIGNPHPMFTYSLGNTFAWRNFDLEIYFQGVYGNTIFNALKVEMESMSTVCNQYASVLDRWNGEGSSNEMPRAIYGDPNNNTRPSTRFLEDGSYLRLKNLTFGYTLPRNISKRIGLDKLRVYVAANNLWTLTSYSGFDPEVGNDGIDWGTYPITRTISVGLNVKF